MFHFDLSEMKTWNRNTFRHKTSWNQAELKAAAWKYLLPNYKWCVVVSLILGIITQWLYYLYNPGLLLSMGLIRWIARVPKMSLVAVIFIILGILVFGPLEVGCRQFYLANSEGKKPNAKGLLFIFKSGYYGNVMTVMLVRNALIYLGTLLLVIPGFYLYYRYLLVPYLLAEQPGMKLQDAMDISTHMMEGQKWDAFLLDLSFWPFLLMSMLTYGIAGALFGWPYRHAANCELYRELVLERYFH